VFEVRRRRRSLTPLLAVLVPLMLVLGIWMGGHPDSLPGFARDVLVGDSEGRLYEEALDTIAENYYREVDKDKLFDEGMAAGIESLDDRFSAYFDPKQYKEFEEATEGAFEGVGMSVNEVPRGLRVLTVYDDSPAQRGGIKKGDLIVSVGGKSLAGRTSQEATTQIKGPAGTEVTLGVISGDKPARDVTLERARVDVPAVEAEMRRLGDRKFAHVRLAGFTSGAHGQVREAVDKLLDEGAEGVVLDLRDNGGGLLNEAVLTSSIFVGDGTIVSTKGLHRPRRVFEAEGTPIDRDVPVVVLVNENSASASEIVTGALQDRGRAEVVGETTFGKGVFQEIRRLTNGGALDITVGEYFTPDGRNLGGKGVEPDVKAVDDPKTKRDEGLQEALEVVAARQGT
jgi:carboxyl-terminal processing protease